VQAELGLLHRRAAVRLDEPLVNEARSREANLRFARGTGEHRLVTSDELDCLVHDLRGPVLAMEHELALFEREVDPVAQRSLRALRGNLEFLRRLLHDVTLTLRPQQREAVCVSLGTLVDAVIARLPQAAQARVHVDERTRASVHVDPTRIERVIANLVGNAVRYTDGVIVIRIERVNANARLTVIDAGAGLSADVAARVFDRGERSEHGGEGLGLHLARTIVESYGGRIAVETAPGEGARFYFELAAVAPSGQPGATRVTPATSSILCGASVLLVDDDLHQLRALAEILRGERISVVTATSGPECLIRVMAQRPEVVVLDLNVPGSDPVTLANSLAKVDAALPVILTTGLPSDHPAVVRTLAATHGWFLPKPFDPAALFLVLEHALMTPRRTR
jgi:CheY-like chemotaxis protein/anti-sigma regulatory factor (Ser/Thr protein kinase)